MMESLWHAEPRLPVFGPLTRDIRTDVLIIGGGMAGLLCAHFLKSSGIDCVVAEAGRICGGVTQNTTAKITAQHGLLYHKLAKRLGYHRAALYLDANQAALDRYRTLCQGIDCDFETKDNYVYSRKDPALPERELSALEKLHAPADFVASVPLPFDTAGAVRFRNQAQFHPLKFIAAICQDLPIFEHTRVLSLDRGTARTSGSRIQAEKVIVATHFPFLNTHGSYFLKLYQHRSYVLGLHGAGAVEGMYADENDKGLSFRSAGDCLLLGGGGHRTGKPGGSYPELTDFKNIHYPEAKIAYQWAAQDCKSLDGMPYIGQYSALTPNLFVATGFNKWGMTSSMVAAQLLRDLVLGKDNPYAELFSPSRNMLHRQLAVNAAESAFNLLTPTVPRCPHLGCALKYNRAEHSWDCPCHGSRFSEDGKLLNGPATGDKKIRRR